MLFKRLTKVLKGAQSAEDKKSAQIQEERKTKKINENNEAWELKSSGGFRYFNLIGYIIIKL